MNKLYIHFDFEKFETNWRSTNFWKLTIEFLIEYNCRNRRY
jgi:hypothetical protein